MPSALGIKWGKVQNSLSWCHHSTGDKGCCLWLRKTGHCIINVCKEADVVTAYQSSLAKLR